jgi:hypothetical protein
MPGNNTLDVVGSNVNHEGCAAMVNCAHGVARDLALSMV